MYITNIKYRYLFYRDRIFMFLHNFIFLPTLCGGLICGIDPDESFMNGKTTQNAFCINIHNF